MKEYKIINGNSYEELKKFPDNYFDSVVTDPPYGLGKEPNANEMLKAWIETGYMEVKGKGFMGKEWDAFVPQPIFWKEVFRVLKHGGHVVAFYGTRTYDWGVMAMRLAGFEIRDGLQWLYGSGFPKSHNISKAIDKMYGAEREVVGKTDQAKQWDGWGSALKPAVEPIVLARKPLEKGLSIAENVLNWGTGALNIDGCRINVNLDAKQKTNNLSKIKFFDNDRNDLEKPIETYKSGGRFPANLLLSHHEDCECIGTKKVDYKGGGDGGIWERGNGSPVSDGYADENGEETIEDWNCVDGCPIRILDEQSGESKSSNSKRNRNTIGSFGMPNDNTLEYSDKGGASRFFYVAKASKSERNKGLDEFEERRPDIRTEKGMGTFEEKGVAKQSNFHPTVKPIKLMQYLVRLITPPNGIVLDPFNGSGTTGIACTLEGFEYTGIELDADYCKISEARINAWREEKDEDKEDNQLNLF